RGDARRRCPDCGEPARQGDHRRAAGCPRRARPRAHRASISVSTRGMTTRMPSAPSGGAVTVRTSAAAARSAPRAGPGPDLAGGSSNGRPRGSTAVASCSSGGRRSRRTTSPSFTSPRPSWCGAHLWDRLLAPGAYSPEHIVPSHGTFLLTPPPLPRAAGDNAICTARHPAGRLRPRFGPDGAPPSRGSSRPPAGRLPRTAEAVTARGGGTPHFFLDTMTAHELEPYKLGLNRLA